MVKRIMPPYLQLLVLTLVSNGISSGVAKPIVDNINSEPDELLDKEPPGCNHDEVRTRTARGTAIIIHS